MSAIETDHDPGQGSASRSAREIDRTRFRWWFAGLVAAAGVFRILYVIILKYDDTPTGDEIYYSAQAITIFKGGGYSYPFPPGGPAANHAPLTAAALAPISWDYNGWTGNQRLLMAVYGTIVVAAVGLLTARLFGRRPALVATAITGFYGAFWLNDVVLMSETFAAAGVVAILWLAYAYRHHPRTRVAVGLGIAIGVTGLARAELLVFGGLVAAVLILTTSRADAAGRGDTFRDPPAPDGVRDDDADIDAADGADASRSTGPSVGPSLGRGVAHVLIAGLCSVAVIAPWLIRNNIRFEETTLISSQDGLTLIGANCPEAYEGQGKGFWQIVCIDRVTPPEGADQSVRSGLYREAAIDYIDDNTRAVPGVVAARVGRGLSIWRPDQMTFFNTGEGRGRWGSRVATLQFWILVPIAIVGLRRWPSSAPRWPIYSTFAFSIVVFAVLYGLPRFRVAAEIGIVIAAAVAIDGWISSFRSRRAALG